MQDPKYQRGILLLQQHRYDLAEQAFRQALADQPHHELGHAMLSLCLRELDRQAEGIVEAQTAIGLDPELALGHYALALNLLDRKKHAAALAASREAVRLDPHDADFHAAEAVIELTSERFREGLAAADRGLACNPKHTQCLNLRAMALRHLGRGSEAQAASGQVLADAPEDSLAHAVHAWNFLEQGRVPEALAHFGESLRLDPNNEYARLGMVEALKARYRVYRWFFAFRVWQARLGRRLQWVFIIGLLVFMRTTRAAGNAVPAFELPARILIGLYMAFVFLSWAGTPLSNLLLRLNRFGRQALNRHETRSANAVGVCLLLAATCALLAIVPLLRAPGIAGGIMFVVLILPVAAVFSARAGWPRWAMGGYAALLLLIAVAAIALATSEQLAGNEVIATKLAVNGTVACLIGAALGTWLSLLLPKRE
ncbi:MAG: tetratricopeptide repeat protein [Pirellulales bacterium]